MVLPKNSFASHELQRKQTTLSDIMRLAGDSWPQKGPGEVWKKILTFLNSKKDKTTWLVIKRYEFVDTKYF